MKPVKQPFSLKSGIATVENNIASIFLDIKRKPEIQSNKMKLLSFEDDSKLFYDIYLIWKKGRKLSPAYNQFKNYLISCCNP